MLLPRLPWDTLLLGGLALLCGWLATQLHPTLFSQLTSLILGLGLAAVLVRGYLPRRARWFPGTLRLLPVLIGLVIVAGVALWLATVLNERSRLAALPAVSDARPNLILLVIDTQRADHLSLYGYPRPTSPNVDRFAKQSWTFDNATASAPWTLPSHATMMTGHHLAEHRAGVAKRPYLDGRFTTIAETLETPGTPRADLSPTCSGAVGGPVSIEASCTTRTISVILATRSPAQYWAGGSPIGRFRRWVGATFPDARVPPT
jgi:hypothetical protein